MAKAVVYYPISQHPALYPILASLFNRSNEYVINVNRLYLNNSVPYSTGASLGVNMYVYKVVNTGSVHTTRTANVVFHDSSEKFDVNIEATATGPTLSTTSDWLLLRRFFFGSNTAGSTINNVLYDSTNDEHKFYMLNFYDSDTQPIVLRQNEGIVIVQDANAGNALGLSIFADIETE